jgi:glycosyltransferase involved in cell wall biosynthesis
MAPMFSVVIPTYNRSNLFPLAVRSILSQTFDDFEVVVSDNYSTDDTQAVASQFKDPRVRYVRTPRHLVIADSWEFARTQARGKLILMLSDDDAMVNCALERFAYEASHQNADFIFSAVAKYRDQSFPGPEKNSVDCPAFSGSSRVVTVEEFVGPLFEFRPQFDMHPSAFVFSKAIADSVQQRTGRFFWTNGVEYSAWPMSAVFARRIVYVDAPLNILGRTGKSWGSNTQLCNPGKERIQAFIEDIDHQWKYAPLNNFANSNLMAEGMLTAKNLFPKEFAAFEFDEVRYLRAAMSMLCDRRALGVDVTREIEETVRYAQKYPSLSEEFKRQQQSTGLPRSKKAMTALRTAIGDLGVRKLRRRLRAHQLSQELKQVGHSSFSAWGEDFEFRDILGCAEFVGSQVMRSWSRLQSGGTSAASAPAMPIAGRQAS